MEVVYPPCAAFDVHKKTATACCVHSTGSGQKQEETRTFGTTTRDLLALHDWLQTKGCTHMAMESTGVYWQPVDNFLAGSAKLLLANAPGRVAKAASLLPRVGGGCPLGGGV